MCNYVSIMSKKRPTSGVSSVVLYCIICGEQHKILIMDKMFNATFRNILWNLHGRNGFRYRRIRACKLEKNQFLVHGISL